MCLANRIGNQTFRTAEAFGKFDELDTFQNLACCFGAVYSKGNHAAEAGGLRFVDFITGMIFIKRIVHAVAPAAIWQWQKRFSGAAPYAAAEF